MKEKIGMVKLNYSFYNENEIYSDGDKIEEELLEICKNGDIERTVYESNKWPILYHLSDIRGNIIDWYPFKENCTVLEVGCGCGAISGFLCKKANRVVGIELSKRRSIINAYRNKDCDNLEIYIGNFKNIELNEKFDYVTLIGVLEYSPNYIGGDQPFETMINSIKKYLKPEGKILIAIENKMGLKYLNGAKEDHVGKSFIGMEDYRYISSVRTFSKPELCDLLKRCNIDKYEFYYPVPDYKMPLAIYSDQYLPKIGDVRIWGMNYDQIRYAFYNEAIMADQVCKDELFSYFANSFLLVCNEDNNNIRFASYTNERKKEYQTKTIIYDEGNKVNVKKEFLKQISREYNIFNQMNENYMRLQDEYNDINYLKPMVIDNVLTYEYINGNTVDVELSMYVHDINKLLSEIKKIINKYLCCHNDILVDFNLTTEYENIFGKIAPKTKEKSLPITNLDLLFHNIIIKDNVAYCFDYEWVYDFPIPYEFVLYRMIVAFYSKYNMYFSKMLNKKNLLIELGVKEENISVYNQMEQKFSEFAHGKNNCMKYLTNYRKPNGMIEFKGL